MFVRKNRNRSGSVSIQIISKNNGRYRVVQTLGSSSDSDEIALLTLAAKQVIARLAYPTSKLKTVDYLYRYQGINVSVDAVYCFLDKLHSTHKPQVEQIAYKYTKKRLGGTVSVVFYDLTTLYFEAEGQDQIRPVNQRRY